MKFFLIAILAILFFTYILEFLAVLFGIIVYPTAATGAITILWTILNKAIKSSPTNKNCKTHTSENLLENIASGFSIIGKSIRNDFVALTIFICTFGFLISIVLAWFHIGGWIYVGIRYAFNTIDPTQNQAVVSIEPTISNSNNKNLPIESNPSLQPTDESLGDTSVIKQITLMDLNRDISLKPNEIEEIYFITGQYMFENYGDKRDVFYCINGDLQILLSEKKMDQYTNIAPSEIDARISQASRVESMLKTSEQLDEIIECRKSVYEQYPMYTLAKLIAENYALFGLAYQQNEGNITTIEYYYGQAILWYREALRYCPTNEGIKQLLYFLAIRYHDLASCLPQGSDIQQRATALANAYYTKEGLSQ